MPHKILIVEDNENNSSLFRDILNFHGYEVSVATDGQEGVTLARELMPDLILMDIQMPGMDGMTVGGILKGDPVTSGLKIVALGVRASRELRVAALTREPAAPRPVPPNAIVTYVAQGGPAPTPKAAQHFRLWLQDLMGEARSEEALPETNDAESEFLEAVDLDELSVDTATALDAGAPDGTSRGAPPSAGQHRKVSGHSRIS